MLRAQRQAPVPNVRHPCPTSGTATAGTPAEFDAALARAQSTLSDTVVSSRMADTSARHTAEKLEMLAKQDGPDGDAHDVTVLGKAHPKEVAFAQELADRGHHVVVRGKNVEGADLLVDDIPWEFKTLERSTVNAVRSNLRKGLKQGAGRVFIDGRQAGLSRETAVLAVQQHHAAQRMDHAIEVRILTIDGEYIWKP